MKKYDGVIFDIDGTLTPIRQAANVTVLDSHTLSVTPWDKSLVQVVDKAILNAYLGLTSVSDGTNLEIPIHLLTEERRKDLVNLVKKFGEDCKIAIHNVRREGNDPLKRAEKDKKITKIN